MDKLSFNGTVVNQVIQSLHGFSLKITQTVFFKNAINDSHFYSLVFFPKKLFFLHQFSCWIYDDIFRIIAHIKVLGVPFSIGHARPAPR